MTELCLRMRVSLSYVSCLSLMYRGDRDLCFDGRGSLDKLSALIYTDDFMCWRWKVWLSREAAIEVSGEQSAGLRIGLTE